MYDPPLGRFTQNDPIAGNRPIEHYVYASNLPVTMVDPLGLKPGDWWDPRTWAQVAKDTAYYAFVDESNTLRAAYVREQQHLERVADRVARQTGNAGEAIRIATYTALADATGGTDAYEAATGNDLESFVETGNMHILSGEERAQRGISAVTKAAGTALSVAGMTGKITSIDVPTRIKIGGRYGVRVTTIKPGTEGKMTLLEVEETQARVEKYNTRVDVGGSRASGFGRNINKTELPAGKGPGTRSDIDFRIDHTHPQVRELTVELKNVGGGAGSAGPRWSYVRDPTHAPYIRFQPGTPPAFTDAPPGWQGPILPPPDPNR